MAGRIGTYGINPADMLVFGGDVGTTAGVAPNYAATSEIAATPFLLNAFPLNATDAAGLASDPPHIIAENALRLAGAGVVITPNGAGPVTLNLPAQIIESLLLPGNGAGAVTITDSADITLTPKRYLRLVVVH